MQRIISRQIALVGLLSLTCGLLVSSAQAQELKQTSALTKVSTKTGLNTVSNGPKFSEYRGVRIGMTADEARQKLGKAKDKDKSEDIYIFSGKESAQVYYDDKERVYAISVDYTGKDSAAPAAVDVLGEDVTPKSDGSIYRMQQYADAGYWVSYNRTAGNSPVVTVTMQKLAGSK